MTHLVPQDPTPFGCLKRWLEPALCFLVEMLLQPGDGVFQILGFRVADQIVDLVSVVQRDGLWKDRSQAVVVFIEEMCTLIVSDSHHPIAHQGDEGPRPLSKPPVQVLPLKVRWVYASADGKKADILKSPVGGLAVQGLGERRHTWINGNHAAVDVALVGGKVGGSGARAQRDGYGQLAPVRIRAGKVMEEFWLPHPHLAPHLAAVQVERRDKNAFAEARELFPPKDSLEHIP